MVGNLLVEKSKAFALKGIELYKLLLDAREYVLSKQPWFLFSGTSQQIHLFYQMLQC